jgi:MtaA/CmuA family methyltransferase
VTGRERVFSYLQGKTVDKIPNFNITMYFAAKYAGIPYGRFCLDHKAIVEANVKTSLDFGFDIINQMCDPYRETDDFGAEFEYYEDKMPKCRGLLLEDKKRIHSLKPFHPLEKPRSLERIKAVRLAKEKVGNELVVYGHLDGPIAVAVMLRGMENFMMDFYDDPDFVEELLEIITQVNIATVREEIKAGADMIVMGEAAASLLSPEIYRKYGIKYEKRVIDAIHENGAIARMHICGNTTHLLPYFTQLGLDIIDLDWMVDLANAQKVFDNKLFISGNIDPVSIYLQGSREAVREKIKDLISLGYDNLIISSGCEIPMNSPVENVLAHHEALVDFTENLFK